MSIRKALFNWMTKGLSPADAEQFFLQPRGRHSGNTLPWGTATDRNLQEAYDQSALVYACVNKICWSFGKAPFKAGRQDEGGKWQDQESEVVDLLNNPNPDFDTQALGIFRVAHLLLTGWSYTWKLRDSSGAVRELWPLPTTWVHPELRNSMSEAGPGESRIFRSFQVNLPTGSFTCDPNDIIVARLVHPSDYSKALAPLVPAYNAYRTDLEADMYVGEMLTNTDLPGTVIVSELELTPEQRDNVKASLKSQSGRGSRGSSIILYGPKSKMELPIPLKDFDWPGLRNLSESRVCALYGVPPELIGLRVGLERSTYNNKQEAKREFYQNTMTQWWDFDGAVLTKGLITAEEGEEGLEVYHDYENLPAVKDDQSVVDDRATKLVTAGLITVNEGRQLAGFDEDTQRGDYYLRGIAVQEVPANEAPEEPPEMPIPGQEEHLPPGEEGVAKPGEKKPPFPVAKKDFDPQKIPGLDRFIMQEGEVESITRGEKEFNPDQPRDEKGEWTDSDMGVGSADEPTLELVEEPSAAPSTPIRGGRLNSKGHDNIAIKDYLSLSKDEQESVRYYSGSGFKDINNSLRVGKLDADTQAEITNIDKAFEKVAPLEKDLVVYRGAASVRVVGEGDTYQDKGFVSTSLNKNIAKHFMEEGALLKITIPKGTRVLFVSGEHNEQEVLLPRSREGKPKFEITKTKTDFKLKTVVATARYVA